MVTIVVFLAFGLVAGFLLPIIIWYQKYKRYFVLDKESEQLGESLDKLREELSELKNDRRNEFEKQMQLLQNDFKKESEIRVQKYNAAREKMIQEQNRLNQSYEHLKEKYKSGTEKLKESYVNAKGIHDDWISNLRNKQNELFQKAKAEQEQKIQQLKEGYEDVKRSREVLLEFELKSLADRIREEKNSLTRVIEENKRKLKESLSELKKNLFEATGKYYEIQKNLNQAEDTIRSASQIEAELSLTERLLASRKGEIETAETRLEAINKKHAEVRVLALIELEEEKTSLTKQIDSLKNEINQNEKILKAIKNTIEGYGTEYMIPGRNLLDELAEDMSHTDSGERLKSARRKTKTMVTGGVAADCDYSERIRRNTAINFVVDAFNGKVDSILSQVKRDNYGVLHQKILDAFEIVNLNGVAFRNARIKKDYMLARIDELNAGTIAYELRLREREEQRRIQEQMREEEKVRREYERAIKEAEKEEEAIRKAVQKAEEQLKEATESQRIKYEQQLEELHARLKAAEEKNQRAISMASQTKSGHVYIISNIGSFGENVYKIGMTRRLEPNDRVHELGDASVPFPFDIHAMIHSEDAPKLEKELHQYFLLNQVNKVNFRKEFFRINLEEIRKEIDLLGIESVHWTMTADATQFRETLAIEKKIAGDPEAKNAWINRQLRLENFLFDDEENEA